MINQTEFWIDVGGTFTDCLMRTSDDRLTTFKVLSSGITKGRVTEILKDCSFRDRLRVSDPPGFWEGYLVTFLDEHGVPLNSCRVIAFDSTGGTFTLEESIPSFEPRASAQLMDIRYELTGAEDGPILTIRTALKLRLNQPIPPVVVRLGTTRGTNALLTRCGARVGL